MCGVPSKMDPAQAPGLIEMGIGPFEAFAALAQQPAARGASGSAAGWHTRRPGRRVGRASGAARGPAPTRSCAAPAPTAPTIVSLLWYPLSATTSATPPPAGSTASTCSAAVTSVSTIVVVSPSLAS